MTLPCLKGWQWHKEIGTAAQQYFRRHQAGEKQDGAFHRHCPAKPQAEQQIGQGKTEKLQQQKPDKACQSRRGKDIALMEAGETPLQHEHRKGQTNHGTAGPFVKLQGWRHSRRWPGSPKAEERCRVQQERSQQWHPIATPIDIDDRDTGTEPERRSRSNSGRWSLPPCRTRTALSRRPRARAAAVKETE